jgi:RNA-directed DNA polymerase
MDDGVVQTRTMGTPQGGPLSPLLANVLLDEVDKALERRGHCFVRYADDANVYVRSRRAGERVMALLRRLYGKLHLMVNETKSAVASVFGRKFLGYGFWPGPGGVIKRKVAEKPLRAFKQRIRQLTCRSGGRSMQDVVDRLRPYVRGWKTYFRLAQTPRVWRELDQWLRHRLRAIQLKQWKRGTTMHRELLAMGAKPDVARRVAANSRRWWRNSGMLLNAVLTLNWSDRLGLPRLS